MPMDEFLATAEALRKLGYRPVRFRPYADEHVTRVAAVWNRDGRNWRISSDLTVDEVRRLDERNVKDKYLAVDVAGYVTTGEDGKPGDRHAALWVESSGGDHARIYVGATADEQTEIQAKLKEEKLIPRTLHAVIAADGLPKFGGAWGRPPGTTITGITDQNQFQGNFEQRMADLGDQLLMDIAVSVSGKPRAIRERVLATLARADKELKSNPDDVDARWARALANFRLGENQKALDDLQFVIGKNPENISAKQYRVITLARLGKKQDALTELAKVQKEEVSESTKLFLAVVVAVEIGEGADKAIEALEAAVKNQPEDADLRYDAARAFSLASRAFSRFDKTKSRKLAERSIRLLKEAVENGEADFGNMDEDSDLDPIRDEPEFADIMTAGHPDRRYAAVWSSDAANFEAIPLYGFDPAAHLQKCRELIANGYRPASLSVVRTIPEGSLATAALWHRPPVKEDVKDRIAERQARAAISLVRMGKADEVWALLRHSTDPRVRSFILNWLNPLGADPRLIVTKLDQIASSTKPTLAPGLQRIDANLFDPDTSMRRALILALGTYGKDGLSPGEREPLIAKLVDLYCTDLDAGIHGAAEWTLKKWGQQDRLKEADAQLIKQNNRDKFRWFVNGQGQTFAVIKGPVEFRMGSPLTDTERIPGNEPPRRIIIPRSFAIATKEVTIAQFLRFLTLAKIKINAQLPPDFFIKFSPDPEGPWIGPDWYMAAHYCNWVSEQERMPKDQWCYVPNEEGNYAEGMSIPANVLDRKGYRLPTEAEWECACRAGTVTSRYYGNSIPLLEAYEWYQANGKEHAWGCGSRLPNDLGLFDMLGNLNEWMQDSSHHAMRWRQGHFIDYINTSESIREKNARVLRGGTSFYPPAFVRSPYRYWYAPALHDVIFGFRPSRTYP
jgi:formylglycine-generating enzyme required for sulfatase activity/tetratricopeptide (TPR) repeat protein